MNVKELKDIIDNIPGNLEDIRLVVYPVDNKVHLSNVFVNKVILEDYTEANLGMILEFVV